MGLLNLKENTQGFQAFVHRQNADNARVFSLVTSIVCLILLLTNTGPIEAIKNNHIYNYTNISSLFFVIFIGLWIVLKFSKNHFKPEKYMTWVMIGASFLFSTLVGYLDVVQGSGPTALALGSVIIAIFFSAPVFILTSLFLLNGILFTFIISTIDGIDIFQYAAAIVAITIFSIVAFIKTEKQRAIIFEGTKKLDIKIDELNNALDVKASFFGHMSHELRTPLNAIIGFSEMLRNEAYFPEKKEKVIEYANFINSGGNHLLELVNDLLDHNKIETGEFNLSLETIDVKKLSQVYIEELMPLSNNRGQTIEFQAEPTSIEVYSDKRLFKQIFYNILSNAQKYSPENTTIGVVLTESGPECFELTFIDQGRGISAELIAQIKNSSSSSNAHYISNAQGTGLGLIIVSQLIKLLGGTIEFSSKIDIGTEVKLKFPRQISQSS